jgi:serpin B
MISGQSQLNSLDELVNGNTRFAIDLYQQLTEPGTNLFFSPYSISIAIAMTYVGASGETARQMAEVLHFPSDPQSLSPTLAALNSALNASQNEGHVILRSANALYPQTGFSILPTFLETMKTYYGATIEALDYFSQSAAAQTRINEWVSNQTEGKINNVIGDGVLGPLTRLVLVNAIYFKGDWAHQFDKARTHRADFWITPNQAVPVDLMAQTSLFDYGETPEMQLLRLPYGDRFSMLVLLPKKDSSIETVEEILSSDNLKHWCDCMRTVDVDVNLPRFKLNSGFLLAATLNQLGMTDASNPSSADFSGMHPELCMDTVIHRAFVEVNEEGSEAAAATVAVMSLRAMPAPNPHFRADRPFIFLIQEHITRTVLFMGKLGNPVG